MRRSTIDSARPGLPLAFLMGALGPCKVKLKDMPHDWDDWEKWKSRHRHGRPDWSRPGRKSRSERHAARDEVRRAMHEARDEVREGLRMARDEIRANRRPRRRSRELTPEEEAHRI